MCVLTNEFLELSNFEHDSIIIFQVYHETIKTASQDFNENVLNTK